MSDPQIQCRDLKPEDFDKTGHVTVLTPLASGYKVTRLNPRATYVIEHCPTFPGGRVCTGIEAVRLALRRQ